MNDSSIERRVLEALLTVAPDVAPTGIARDVAFRDQFDFDSMDTLNFAIGLHQAFDIEIPETDYRHLSSLGQAVAYVEKALAAKRA
jgi:acyl carrier protein